jgi:hypothetical protein
MSVQVLPEMPTLGQALSKSLTQGLGQTLPKSIERGSLSEGLRQLSSRGAGMTPIEQISALARLPGGAELAPSIMPFLQAQAQAPIRKIAREGVATDARDLPQDVQAPVTEDSFLEKSKGSYYMISKPPEVRQREIENIQKETGLPYQYIEPLYQEEEAKRIESEKGFEERKTLAESEFEKEMSRVTQKAGKDVSRDIIGETQQRYLDKVYSYLDQGLSPKESAFKASQDALDFSKTRTILKNRGRDFSQVIKSPSRSVSSLESLKRKYMKLGEEEQFSNDLVNYAGMPRKLAQAFTYGNTPAVKKDISSIKRPLTFPSEKNKNEVFRKILSDLSPRDSLISAAISLEKKKYNPRDFMNFVSQKIDNGDFSPSDLQNRELGYSIRWEPTPGSVYYNLLLGDRF